MSDFTPEVAEGLSIYLVLFIMIFMALVTLILGFFLSPFLLIATGLLILGVYLVKRFVYVPYVTKYNKR